MRSRESYIEYFDGKKSGRAKIRGSLSGATSDGIMMTMMISKGPQL
jgi:hypothetical protein